MWFFLPILILILAGLVLLVMRLALPGFRHLWLVALTGALLALIAVLLWLLHMPISLDLPAWKPLLVYGFAPTWLADGVSFPYALALTTLMTAILLTSVVRSEADWLAWVGSLLLTALGILGVSAGDPLTLILAWTAIDLVELLTMVRSAEGEAQNRSAVFAFGMRVLGSGFVIWADALTRVPQAALSFQNLSSRAGLFILVATLFRLGILPLHLPYQKENVLRRGFGTSLRLVSAAASLAVLARLPATALDSTWVPFLLAFSALPALYAGWMWLRASDEILGRPFWLLGMASLSIMAALRANPLGTIAWGVALILSGGLLFMYSSRHRSILWLPLLGMWGLSTLPYSPSASAWLAPDHAHGWSLIFLLPAQALLLAGYFRHTLHPGETSFESQEQWSRVLYPAGLTLLAGASILLGVFGWEGAAQVGLWWAGFPALLLALWIVLLVSRRFASSPGVISHWGEALITRPFTWLITTGTHLLERVVGLVTFTLEGEGGIFWSILVLVLILSLLSTGVAP